MTFDEISLLNGNQTENNIFAELEKKKRSRSDIYLYTERIKLLLQPLYPTFGSRGTGEERRFRYVARARESRVRSRDVAMTARRPRVARAYLLCMYTRIYHGDTH